MPFETRDDPLFLKVFINDYFISNVLVDTGASFHLCPLGTMKALGLLDDALSPSRMLVHAYDDSTRKCSPRPLPALRGNEVIQRKPWRYVDPSK